MVKDDITLVVDVPGARGEADAQNITVLAMWMIEHPGTEEDDEGGEGGVGQGGADDV